MAKSIMRIDAKKSDLLQRKRVAAYARVSMDTERLMHSLSVQVSYSTSHKSGHPFTAGV